MGGEAYWLIWRNPGDDGWQVGLDPDVPVMLLALSHSHLSVQLLSVLFSPSFLVQGPLFFFFFLMDMMIPIRSNQEFSTP